MRGSLFQAVLTGVALWCADYARRGWRESKATRLFIFFFFFFFLLFLLSPTKLGRGGYVGTTVQLIRGITQIIGCQQRGKMAVRGDASPKKNNRCNARGREKKKFALPTYSIYLPAYVCAPACTIHLCKRKTTHVVRAWYYVHMSETAVWEHACAQFLPSLPPSLSALSVGHLRGTYYKIRLCIYVFNAY